MMNSLKTLVLLGILTAMIVAVGGLLGGRSGMAIAFGIALVTNIGSYWFSAPMALAMSRAQPVERSQAPELYDVVESLCQKAQIPVPTIHIIPSASANAFATGRDPEHAAVAVTEGILQVLNRDELTGVLAHELGHVRNRDILITTIAAVLASTVTFLAHNAYYFVGMRDDGDGNRSINPIGLILMAILAPLAATLVNLALSRSREYEADATGARLCHEPLALATALAKVEQVSQQVPMTNLNPALSSLYITSPNPQSWFVNLLSTHPPTEERIRRLQQMAANMR
jgi:heat shock protein HtpX